MFYGVGGGGSSSMMAMAQMQQQDQMQAEQIAMQMAMQRSRMTPFSFGQDGAQFSDGLYDRGGMNFMPSFGGNYGNFGMNNGMGMVPGFGGFNGMSGMSGMGGMGGNNGMMQMMMQMMQMMMQMMQQMGMQQQNPMDQMQQQQQQNPMDPNQQQNGQGTVELEKGQTFTTPGGCTVNWQGDTVKIHEPGGGQKDMADGFGLAASGATQGTAWAKAAAWGNADSAASAAGSDGVAASAAAHSGESKTADKARDWKVWGDPHIKNPDGSSQDFKTKNAVFSLQDGSKVLMCADKPDGVVNKVRITLPGGQMNLKGVDTKQTAVYGNDGNKLQQHGTLDKYLNAFQNANLNVSPMGNQMFPMPRTA